MDYLPVIITGALSILGGAGLWTYLDHRKQHAEQKEDRQDEILAEIKSLRSDVDGLRDDMSTNDKNINKRLDWEKADQARNRILRFDDELRRSVKHSLEFFNQIIEDCNWYKQFCDKTSDYENAKAQDAIRNILECYHKVKEENDFI